MVVRLTAEERALRAMPEAGFQRQVCDLAAVLGWTWTHWRAALVRKGTWGVPFEGPLGKGWPDLTLARPRDGRLVFAELKREQGTATDEQLEVLEVLRACGAEAYLWRPRDLRDPVETSPIYEVLR